jgi:hypothetical protein
MSIFAFLANFTPQLGVPWQPFLSFIGKNSVILQIYQFLIPSRLPSRVMSPFLRASTCDSEPSYLAWDKSKPLSRRGRPR